MAQRDEWEDPYTDPNPYDYWGRTPTEPEAPQENYGPPYAAPEGYEWIRRDMNSPWELQPRTGYENRYMGQPDEQPQANQQTSYGQPSYGGGGGGGGGFGLPPGRPSFNFGGAPTPDLPAFSYAEMPALDKFAAPQGADVLNEPGYQFRLGQGKQALEQSAAARGDLLTGGRLKELVNYGQNFASNEYGNVYNRAKGEYDTDVDNKFRTYGTNFGVKRDVFDREYRRASDLYAPKFAEWQVGSQAELQSGLSAFDKQWDDYINDKNILSRPY